MSASAVRFTGCWLCRPGPRSEAMQLAIGRTGSLHHPVHRFLHFLENRAKSARVRADPRYLASGAITEFKQMVAHFHDAGLEVRTVAG